MGKIFDSAGHFFSKWKELFARNSALIIGGISSFAGRDKKSEDATLLPAITVMPEIKFIEKKEKDRPEGMLIRLSRLSKYRDREKNVIGIGLIAIL